MSAFENLSRGKFVLMFQNVKKEIQPISIQRLIKPLKYNIRKVEVIPSALLLKIRMGTKQAIL